MCLGRTRAENKSLDNWRNHNTHKIEPSDDNKNPGDYQNHPHLATGKKKGPITRSRASRERKGLRYLFNYFCSRGCHFTRVVTFLIIMMVKLCWEL